MPTKVTAVWYQSTFSPFEPLRSPRLDRCLSSVNLASLYIFGGAAARVENISAAPSSPSRDPRVGVVVDGVREVGSVAERDRKNRGLGAVFDRRTALISAPDHGGPARASASRSTPSVTSGPVRGRLDRRGRPRAAPDLKPFNA